MSVPALLVSPKPPPHHGAARAVEILLAGCGERVEWRHVDARYTGDVSQLNKLRLGKFVALVRYLWQTAWRSRGCRAVVLTPSFQTGTFLKDALFIWLCWLLRRRGLVAWYHMSFKTMRYAARPAPLRWFVRATLRRVRWHVCVAERLLPEMPDFLDRDRLLALPNGIPPICDAAGRDAARGGRTRILYLSHMGEAKGWRVLLAAAERICDRHPAVEFDFYGSPAYETSGADIEAAFAALRHRDRIRHRGFADGAAKARLFAEVDALCFPSLNEAFPITILEAMSAGLPIVASDVGGIADALVDGEGGQLVPPGDAGALEAALGALLDDPDRAARWGAFNLARYRDRFTGPAFCGRWCTFLERAASA